MDEGQVPEGVNDIYSRLFTDDPLLLREENQHLFGAQILRNLLVERGIKAAVPRGVDLSKDDSRRRFKHRPAPPSGPIDPEIKRRYLKSRLTREPLAKKLIEALKPYTMIAMPEHTRDRIGDTFFVDHKVAVQQIRRTESPIGKRLRIAAIGYRVAISRLPNETPLDEELYPLPQAPDDPAYVQTEITGYPEKKGTQKLRRTKLADRDRQAKWFEYLCRHLKHALEREAHIVLGPEFGLPPNLDTAKVENEITRIAQGRTHPFFLFAGTRHEGIHNRGFAITQSADSSKTTERWWHYKAASARGLGENITGPQNALMPSYKFTWPMDDGDTKEYSIFVPICYDVYDPTTFINYVIGCAATDKGFYESIILVPSFNPSTEFVHALRDLSFVAACPVVYVNGLHGDAKLFVCGIDVHDLIAIAQSKARIKAKRKAGKRILPTDSSAIERSIERGRKALLSEQRSLRAELFPLQEITAPAALSASVEYRTSMLQARLNRVAHKIRSLDHFVSQLNDLGRRGALRHLITTEHCPHCKQRGHGGEKYCANDVLYYNLDIQLLNDLQEFRLEFFKDDSFLPKPFTREGKQMIQNLLNAKIDAEAQRKAAGKAAT